MLLLMIPFYLPFNLSTMNYIRTAKIVLGIIFFLLAWAYASSFDYEVALLENQ